MVDELILSQQDQPRGCHLIHQIAQAGVSQIIFFHGDLGLKCVKRHVLKNWQKHTVIRDIAAQNCHRSTLGLHCRLNSITLTPTLSDLINWQLALGFLPQATLATILVFLHVSVSGFKKPPGFFLKKKKPNPVGFLDKQEKIGKTIQKLSNLKP